MRVIDFHCDALYKMLNDGNLAFENGRPGVLDVTYERLRGSDALLQVFAVFISSDRPDHGTIHPILESVDLLYEKVLACPDMRLILTVSDLEECIQDGKTGALLSLEGIDGLRGSLSALRNLYRLGVRAAGFTWNHANWAADGVMEPRGGGLTALGKIFVRECNELGIVVDVSHLSERAFWDMAALSSKPIIASHSNARSVCDHPRNLTDLQIRAIVEGKGRIGITYVPAFVHSSGNAAISNLIAHIEHICELGGERHLMLGSDFDGIDKHVQGLTHPGQVYALIEELLKRYSQEQTEAFVYGNALSFLRGQLPLH
ncbi:dipeptidase [Paenibacillus sp. GCM10027627]|uniref:dipeptidase n=1 Tax=unclassified Paenibacillus TaxID=185978 RepID=UPI00363FEEC8